MLAESSRKTPQPKSRVSDDMIVKPTFVLGRSHYGISTPKYSCLPALTFPV